MNVRTPASALGAILLAMMLALPAWADDGGYSGGVDALDEARELIEMGSFGSAIWQLERFLDEAPDNADAHNLLAYSYRSLRKYDQAARHYERALRLDADHAGAYAYQGVLYLETGRPDKARKNLERIREICGRGCSEYRNLRDAIQQMAASS